MSQYGLPGVRDKEGKRQVVEHSFDWNGNEITVKMKPPTISQQEEYEELGRDASTEKLREIVDRHIVEPTIPDDEEWTAAEVLAFVEGIVDFSTGGGGRAAEAVRDELEDRAIDAGN